MAASHVLIESGVEPAAQAFLDKLAAGGGPGINELSVYEAREVLTGLQEHPAAVLPADIEDREIPVGPDGKINIRIVRPQGRTDLLPAVLYFHGGGWVLGDCDTHDRLIRQLANGGRAAVVFVEFTRAPEAKYPVAIEEAYAATRYIAENGRRLNVDGSKLVVAGDSVGGNMAAAVTLLASERGGPAIDFQVLFYPVTDADFDTGSYRQFATGYFLTREAMKWFWDNYLPEEAARRQPTASPLQASLEELRNLPPALVITGEFDVLRDEGEAYAHKLSTAGVHVTAVRCLGTIHDFMMLNALAETPAARAGIDLATDTLRRVFAE